MFVECVSTFSYPGTGWRSSHGDPVTGCEISPSGTGCFSMTSCDGIERLVGLALLLLCDGVRDLCRSCDGMREIPMRDLA